MILLVAASLAQDPGDPAARGAYVAAAAQCVSCHTAEGGAPWAGGYAIETKFGTFYGPNLTPDPETGLGRWTAEEFTRAVREGRDPAGHGLWPAFPWLSYRHLTDGDIADLWAYLQTIPPVRQEDREHDLPWPVRGMLGTWRALVVRRPEPITDRGEYLATAVVHCGECHTPRGPLGGLRDRRRFEGSDDPPTPSPAIAGLGWEAGDWDSFLQDGLTPDGEGVGGEMRRVIRDGTSKLTDADRAALADWLAGR